MAVETVNSLIDELRQCRILDELQFALIEREAAGQFQEPKQLAKELINRGWLTRFQAKQLLLGRGAELILGSYKLIDRLGSGGMGQVYKAVHVPMNRTVALKVVRPELVADSKTIRRFHREVQAAAQLNHPNIVTVFDASQIGDTHFLAMEFIDGFDFADLVRDSGPLPIHGACDCIRQTALALQHAHERGVVHRDIKPSNLLMTRNPPGMVKVLDMGLARPVRIPGASLENQTALTLDGAVVGTPDFMAPEQAKNSSTVDHRADIYSLGCTFYFLLTGRMPFPVANMMEKLLKHQFEQPYPLELARPDTPAAIAAILQRMIAKDPEDRYQSAGEIAKALEPFCNAPTGPNGTMIEMAAFVPEAAPSSVNTPPPATDVSPFNFGPPPAPAEIGRPRRNGAGRLIWILAGTGILIVTAIIAFVALIAASSGQKPTPTTASNHQELAVTPPAKLNEPPKSVSRQADEDPLVDCLPERAAFALVVNVPQLLNSKAIDAHMSSALKPLLDLLQGLKIDPHRQMDRLLVCVLPGKPDQTFAVLLGSYGTNELREFAHRYFKFTKREGNLAIGVLQWDKERKHYVAMLNESFLAIASDPSLLVDADRRLREHQTVGPDSSILKLLNTLNPNSTVRFAMLGGFAPNAEPLEAAGIHRLSGSLTVSDSVEMDALAQVKDPRRLREQLRLLGSGIAAQALFDPRQAIAAALLRNPQFESQSSPIGQFHEVRIRNQIPPQDLGIILKAISNRMDAPARNGK